MWIPRIPDGPRPLFQRIADAVARDIEDGVLRPGDRLPPQRRLSQELGVALATIAKAFSEAEKRGLLRGEVGRGTFVWRQSGDPLELQPNPNAVELSLALPPSGAFPNLSDALREVAAYDDCQSLLRYTSHAGTRRHRTAGASWARRFGLDADEDRVVLCAGAQHAMVVALSALAEPGDVVLTEELTYPGIKVVAELLHIKLEAVALDDDGLRPDALDEACERHRPKALYGTPTLHNPTGTILSEQRREAIATVLKRHRVPMIEDDVHRLLVPDAPPPICARIPELGFYIASLSKAVVGGLRIAYLVAPSEQTLKLARGIWATIWMPPPLCAEIATRWIESGVADRSVKAKQQEMTSRHAIVDDILQGYVYRSHPHSYHIWLELPEPWRGQDFHDEAQRRGIAIAPAESFIVGRGSAPHAVRICLSAPESRDEIRQALSTLKEILEQKRSCSLGMM